MKKNKKIIIVAILCVLAIGSIILLVNNKKSNKNEKTINAENNINILKTQGKNITEERDKLEVKNIINISSKNAFSELDKIYKVNDNANLYSVSKTKNNLKIGDILNKTNKGYASDQVYLVLRMSYPIISLEEMGLDSEEEAYQVTQLALWEVSSRTGESKDKETRIESIKEELEKNNIKVNEKVFNKAKELVKYIEKFNVDNPKDGLELVPTLMVDNSLVDLIKQEDNKDNKYLIGPYKFYVKNGYFIQSNITTKDEKGNKVEVKYVDRNGKVLDKIGENTEFYISFKELPEKATYKLNINTKVKRNVVVNYENNKNEYIANTYTVEEIPIELTINYEKKNTLGEINLTAYDKNKKPNSGVTFILYDASGKELGKSTTGTDGKINYYKVPEGKYKIVQVDKNNKEVNSKEINVKASEITKVDF